MAGHDIVSLRTITQRRPGMDDGEDDTGSTTTNETEVELTPEQLAAQHLALNELETTMPNQTMQIRRALALLQPRGNDMAEGSREAVAAPIRSAVNLVRDSFTPSLAAAGLPRSVAAPIGEKLSTFADQEAINAARNDIVTKYLSGSPIQMFRPDVGRYLVDPNKQTQTSSTSQGTGATALQAAGLAIGVAAVVIA